MIRDLSHGLAVAALAAGLLGAPAFAQDDGATASGEVVARVNGEPISADALAQLLAQQAQGRGEVSAARRQQFLNEVITVTLLAQDAEERGLDEEPETAAQLENTRRAILAQALVRELSGAEQVSDEAVRELYDERFGDGGDQEYRARHILVPERETAVEIIDELDAGGDFAELAAEHSEDSNAEDGGDLGWFAAADMVGPFAAEVEALAPGEHSDEPVETRFGWHVVQVDDTRTAEPPAFEDVREQLRMELVRQSVQQYVQALRAEAEIDYEADWAEPPQD